MLTLDCPFCGPRSETEFVCGGESHIVRPDPDCSDAAWASYLYMRDNPKGASFERWCHRFGCGTWFNVARDSVTHRIFATYAMTDPKPGDLA